jgi:hypothetical protein
MAIRVRARPAGPSRGKGGGAQGDGDGRVPGQVPEPGGFPAAAADPGQQFHRPGPEHYLLDQLRRRPGAGAAEEEPTGQLAVSGPPGRGRGCGHGTERTHLHDGPGGRVQRVGQAVDGPEGPGLPGPHAAAVLSELTCARERGCSGRALTSTSRAWFSTAVILPAPSSPAAGSASTEPGFSGGEVSFYDAGFFDGVVSFVGAEFSGGTVDFTRVGTWSHPPAFDWDGKPPLGVILPPTVGSAPRQFGLTAASCLCEALLP